MNAMPNDRKWLFVKNTQTGAVSKFGFTRESLENFLRKYPYMTVIAPFSDENSDAKRICYGVQTADGRPACDGRYVKRVRVFSPESHMPFATDYCEYCQNLAIDQGCKLETII